MSSSPPSMIYRGVEYNELDGGIIKRAVLIKEHKQYETELSKTGKTYPSKKIGLDSFIIFAQYEAGSGICVNEKGYIITCGHCISHHKNGVGKYKLILFTSGLLCRTECVKWDYKKDLALLKIVGIASDSSSSFIPPPSSICFPSIKLDIESPKIGIDIICFGQAGRDDLESETDKKTNYPLISISVGCYRGLVDDGKNVHDNSDIGQLKHDAWTYWGYSGAPLISMVSGNLIGIHSSWDDDTCMRHGIALPCIREFIGDLTDDVVNQIQSN
jgi:hypothetical protein